MLSAGSRLDRSASSSARWRAAAGDGFTLLEMLVVVAVMALVAGLLFPRIERLLEAARFAAARSDLSAAAAAARAQAVRTDSIVVLEPSADRRALLRNGRIVLELPDGVGLAASRPALRFFGDGSGISGTMLLSAGDARAELRIDPMSGGAAWRR